MKPARGKCRKWLRLQFADRDLNRMEHESLFLSGSFYKHAGWYSVALASAPAVLRLLAKTSSQQYSSSRLAGATHRRPRTITQCLWNEALRDSAIFIKIQECHFIGLNIRISIALRCLGSHQDFQLKWSFFCLMVQSLR